ncbi:MAG TPA: hypothetical protein VLK65_21335 [Vicinamibacteria bacterium]|nr:hypothetical protein [Vicinamibacteria bacterium]
MRSKLLLCGLVLMLASAASAQSRRVEILPFVGYTVSTRFDISPTLVAGESVRSLGPASDLSYGFAFNIFATENASIGFQWSRQESMLEAEGTRTRNLTDLAVYNYHVIYTYNWLEENANFRPFLFGGLGATQYVPGEVIGFPVDSETRFSSTWGGGVKFYPAPAFGLALTARWTPTQIRSDPAGFWCSPYWGCFVLEQSKHSHQFEFTGGLSFRF